MEVFDLKIRASIVADAFCGLHNDKYIKFQPYNNCRLRAICCELIYPAEIFIFLRKGLGSSDLH